MYKLQARKIFDSITRRKILSFGRSGNYFREAWKNQLSLVIMASQSRRRPEYVKTFFVQMLCFFFQRSSSIWRKNRYILHAPADPVLSQPAFIDFWLHFVFCPLIDVREKSETILMRRKAIRQLPKSLPSAPPKWFSVIAPPTVSSIQPPYIHAAPNSSFYEEKNFFLSQRTAESSILQKITKISIKMEDSAIKCYGILSACTRSNHFREGIWCWHSYFVNKLVEKSKIAKGKFVPKPLGTFCMKKFHLVHFIWKPFAFQASFRVQSRRKVKYTMGACVGIVSR